MRRGEGRVLLDMELRLDTPAFRWTLSTTPSELEFVPLQLLDWQERGALVSAAVEFQNTFNWRPPQTVRSAFDPGDLTGPLGFIRWVRRYAEPHPTDWRVTCTFGVGGASFRPCSLRQVLERGAQKSRRSLELIPTLVCSASVLLFVEWL